MTGAEKRDGGGTRHLAWILPILAIPFLFFGFILVAGTMYNTGDPIVSRLGLLPHIIALTTPLAALVVAVIVIVRILRQARLRGPGAFERRRLEDARRRGLTPEEYGVDKGNTPGLSSIRPVNSAGGLLVISIILTVLAVFLLVMIGAGILQNLGVLAAPPDATQLSPVQWFFTLFSLVFPVVSWRYYLRERRAQALRVARGLPRVLAPTDRSGPADS